MATAASSSSPVAMLTRLIPASAAELRRGANQLRQRPSVGEQFRRGNADERGAVERCNGAWRYEFYGVHDLPSSVEALNPSLDSFQHLYHYHRPHGAPAGQTPAAYLAKRQARPSRLTCAEPGLSLDSRKSGGYQRPH